MNNPVRWTAVVQVLDVVTRMHSQQLIDVGQWRIVELEIDIEPGGNQAVVDGTQSIRAFRMMSAHIVLPTVAVCNESSYRHEERLI
jgi:hypothetical protein